MVYFATIIQRAVLRVQSVQGVATCSFLHGVFLDIDQIIPLKSAEMSSPCIFLGSSPILFYILYSILFKKIDTLTSLKRPDKFI